VKYLFILFFVFFVYSQNRNDLIGKSVIGVPVPIKDHTYFNFYNYYSNTNDYLIFSYELNIQQFVFDQYLDSNMHAIVEYSLFMNNKTQSLVEIWTDTLDKEMFKESKFISRSKQILTNLDSFTYTFKIRDRKTEKDAIYNNEKPFLKSDPSILLKSAGSFLANKFVLEQIDSIEFVLNTKNKIENSFTLDIEYKSYKKSFSFKAIDDQNMLVRLDLNKLAEDKYTFIVRSLEKIFFKENIIIRNWKLPFSLREVNFALQPFLLILSEKDADLFKSLNDQQKTDFFYDYWQKKLKSDHINNPLMLEYYKRIDFAILNYSNKLDRGWETDRGKTYILYGKPTQIEKRIQRNREYEIWVYEEFKKIFTKENMIYKLVNNGSISD
jgi:GWxTD domain-containing protein